MAKKTKKAISTVEEKLAALHQLQMIDSEVDKIRIGQFMKSPKGMSFIALQTALQALNPTFETKLYNPLSLI